MLGQAKLWKGTRGVDAQATQSWRFQAKTKLEHHDYEQGGVCSSHLNFTWSPTHWWCPALLAAGRWHSKPILQVLAGGWMTMLVAGQWRGKLILQVPTGGWMTMWCPHPSMRGGVRYCQYLSLKCRAVVVWKERRACKQRAKCGMAGAKPIVPFREVAGGRNGISHASSNAEGTMFLVVPWTSCTAGQRRVNGM